MSRIERTIEIDAAPEKVFAFVAAEWETDLRFAGGPRHAWSPERPARLREGFRARFEGELLALPGWREVEVQDFVEYTGWTARSVSLSDLTWTVRFAPSGRQCQATQVCEHRPEGIQGRLDEWTRRRRRRARAVEQSLLRLKGLVERQESLERLQRKQADRLPRD